MRGAPSADQWLRGPSAAGHCARPERFFKVKQLDLGGSDHNSGEKLVGRPQGTLARISGSDISRLFHRRGTRPAGRARQHFPTVRSTMAATATPPSPLPGPPAHAFT